MTEPLPIGPNCRCILEPVVALGRAGIEELRGMARAFARAGLDRLSRATVYTMHVRMAEIEARRAPGAKP